MLTVNSAVVSPFRDGYENNNNNNRTLQFRVMGFGLTNAPATFQALMNSKLQPYIRDFVVVFLDDILIFSKTWSEHLRHASTVL